MKITCPNCRKVFDIDSNCRKVFDIDFRCVQCGEVFSPRVRYPHYEEHRDEMSKQDKNLENYFCGGL